MSRGTTSNYAIYSEGGASYHAGNLYLGRLPSGNDSLYKLVIQGSLCVDDGTANCPAAPTAGAIYVENSVGAGNVSAFDISEYYPAIEPVEKGEIVSAAGNSAVKKSSGSYDPAIVGIVSTDPAFVIDETNITFGKTAGDNFNPLKPYIALAGRVPVKVSTENGSIKPGDPLTSSSTPGVAMKATSSGPTIGKALEAFSGPGVGKIVAFVSVGWFVQPLAAGGQSLGTNLSSIDTQTLTAGKITTQLLIIGDRKITMSEAGALTIDADVEIAGNLKVAGSVNASTVATDELVVSDKSSGTDVVTAGTKELEVEATVVKETSKVFITFNSDYSPATRLWVSKKAGKSFTVHLDQPTGANSTFDWFIVN
jgi:hypothetical protein